MCSPSSLWCIFSNRILDRVWTLCAVHKASNKINFIDKICQSRSCNGYSFPSITNTGCGSQISSYFGNNGLQLNIRDSIFPASVKVLRADRWALRVLYFELFWYSSLKNFKMSWVYWVGKSCLTDKRPIIFYMLYYTVWLCPEKSGNGLFRLQLGLGLFPGKPFPNFNSDKIKVQKKN